MLALDLFFSSTETIPASSLFRNLSILNSSTLEVELELKVKTLLFKARISGVEIFKAETGPSTYKVPVP